MPLRANFAANVHSLTVGRRAQATAPVRGAKHSTAGRRSVPGHSLLAQR